MTERLLLRGVAALPVALRESCLAAVLAHQEADGGFRGRDGAADDWYTDFAVRVLALTAGADDARQRASAWLAQRTTRPIDIAAAHARANAAFALNLLGQRTPLAVSAIRAVLAAQTVPGGYALPGERRPSVSQGFLADHTWRLLGRPLPDRQQVIATVLAQQRTDGGFADSGADSASQGNATAAALTFLARHQALEPAADRATAFVAALQADDGGLRAHAGLPQGDLLATFTGVWALATCGRLDRPRLGDLGRFVQACRNNHGFGACPGDPGSDPEYVFYGLATLGLLAARAGCGTARSRPWPGLRGLRGMLLAWPSTRRLGWRLIGG